LPGFKHPKLKGNLKGHEAASTFPMKRKMGKDLAELEDPGMISNLTWE
jgi:hypothetical protein